MDLYVIKWHLTDSRGEIMCYNVYRSAFLSMEDAVKAKNQLLDNKEKNWIKNWGEDCVYKDTEKGFVRIYRFKTTPYYLFLEISKINIKEYGGETN